MALSARQIAFIDHYFTNGFNASAACVSAGYSPKGANVTGSQLLARPSIAEEVEKRKTALAKKTEITSDWLISNAKLILEHCLAVDSKSKRMYSPRYALVANEQIAKLTGLIDKQQDTNITIQIEREKKPLEVLEDFSEFKDQITAPTTDTTSIQPNLQLVKAPVVNG